VEELTPKPSPVPHLLRAGLRAVAVLLLFFGLAALLAFAFMAFGKWAVARLQDGVEFEGVHVQAYGLRMERWERLSIDSLRISVASQGISVDAAALRLRAFPGAWPDGASPCAVEADLRRLRIAIDTSVHAPADTSALSWPDLAVPASVLLHLDTLDLSVGREVRVLGIEAKARRGQDVSVHLAKAIAYGVPVDLSLRAHAAWKERDTVRIDGGGRVWGGCCSNDSFELSAALRRKDLRQGSARAALLLSNVSGWADLLPALSSAPHLGRWRVDATARASSRDTSLSLHARGSMEEFYPLPASQLDLQADADGKGTRLLLSAGAAGGFLIRARLGTPFSPTHWNARMAATGDIEVHSWNMQVSTYSLPLDAHIDVLRLDKNGAKVLAHMRSGSLIAGESNFSPLSWKLDAEISPKEPWATTWLPGLAIDSGAHIVGRDSGGGTVAEVVARHPNWSKLALDSVRARLWLDTRHLLFESLRTHEGARELTGTGEVNWTDWFWRFEASPLGDTASTAKVGGKIPGEIHASLRDFPLNVLPLAQWRGKFFDARLTADLIHRPGLLTSFDSAVGRLRAKPSDDSLTAVFELSRQDTVFQLKKLSTFLGPDHLQASATGRMGSAGFQLDTMVADFDSIHLERLIRLNNPHAQAGGLFKGGFRSGPGGGLQASARLEGGWIEKEGGALTKLPDLMIWGKHDSLNVGGFWPLGAAKIPFKASIVGIFDQRRDFTLLAFPGDSLRLKAQGHLDSLVHASLQFRLDGSQSLGSGAMLQRISLEGTARASKKNGAWDWHARAADSTTRFSAPGGNVFDLSLHLRANPQELRIDTVRMKGVHGGLAQFQGRYELPTGKFQIAGHMQDLELGVGANRFLSVAAADVTTSEDGLLHAQLRRARYRETYAPGQVLDARIGEASLQYQMAKDWNKLSGTVQITSALYSRAIPEPMDFLRSLASRRDVTASTSSSGKPLLLDLSVSSLGDSIRLANNVAQARLAFDIAVNGPSSSPLLTGSVNTSDTVSSFQYVGKPFRIEEFQLAWAGQPLEQGQYKLSGSRQIRSTCNEETQTVTSSASSDSCSVVLNSSGTLSRPQLETPVAKTCAADATAQASLQALALGCYPQSSGGAAGTNPSYLQMGTALAMGQMRSWVNDVVNSRLKGQSDQGLAFLPDSVMFKELPRENTQDRMVLAVGKKLSDRFDIEAEYTHVFTARADATSTTSGTSSTSSSSTSASSVNADDYTLRLRFHPPFDWVDDSDARMRLQERVLLQVETRQTKGWIPSNETLLKPSIRYRWEFW
jgi:hypothetical protein